MKFPDTSDLCILLHSQCSPFSYGSTYKNNWTISRKQQTPDLLCIPSDNAKLLSLSTKWKKREKSKGLDGQSGGTLGLQQAPSAFYRYRQPDNLVMLTACNYQLHFETSSGSFVLFWTFEMRGRHLLTVTLYQRWDSCRIKNKFLRGFCTLQIYLALGLGGVCYCQHPLILPVWKDSH